MKTRRISLIALGVTATVLRLCTFHLQAADQSNSVLAILKKYSDSPQLSPALEEIVKLTKGGVGDSVTLAYIQSSTAHFSMDAQDVIELRKQGVSTQVVSAMFQHCDSLRRAAAGTNQPVTLSLSPANSAPAAALPSQPATVNDAPEPTYQASSVSVTYFGSPNYASYPGYHGYGYGGAFYAGGYAYAPRFGYGCIGPRVGFGFGCQRGHYGGYGPCR